MDVTVFKLFGGLLKPVDMKILLSNENISATDFETPCALALRCFLLLLDMQGRTWPEQPEATAEATVETEERTIKLEQFSDIEQVEVKTEIGQAFLNGR